MAGGVLTAWDRGRRCQRTTLCFVFPPSSPTSGSLEPDEDPLCMLLLIDHLALRARSYDYLIRLFQEWEVGVGVRGDAGRICPLCSVRAPCTPRGSAKQWAGLHPPHLVSRHPG